MTKITSEIFNSFESPPRCSACNTRLTYAEYKMLGDFCRICDKKQTVKVIKPAKQKKIDPNMEMFPDSFSDLGYRGKNR
jgi:predicted amidophosphoribosyltransferase